MTIKKTIKPKYRLPVLNWVSMKPNQVKGTIFADLDDEKLYEVSISYLIYNNFMLLQFLPHDAYQYIVFQLNFA